MKGIILAGGEGTRLLPLTKVINKSILPVYDKPLIYYPIMTLKSAGIEEILIISGRGHAGQFLDLLGDGKELGVKLTYTIQEKPVGIAQGLSLAKDFADEGPVTLILGDNIFEDDFHEVLNDFKKQGRGARIVLKEVSDPQRFGVAEFSEDESKILSIEEKPTKPKSSWIATGLYMYDERVFDVIRGLTPSAREEYEITDVNNFYVKEGSLSFVKIVGEWIDAGTFESLLRANNFIANKQRKQD